MNCWCICLTLAVCIANEVLDLQQALNALWFRWLCYNTRNLLFWPSRRLTKLRRWNFGVPILIEQVERQGWKNITLTHFDHRHAHKSALQFSFLGNYYIRLNANCIYRIFPEWFALWCLHGMALHFSQMFFSRPYSTHIKLWWLGLQRLFQRKGASSISFLIIAT